MFAVVARAKRERQNWSNAQGVSSCSKCVISAGPLGYWRIWPLAKPKQAVAKHNKNASSRSNGNFSVALLHIIHQDNDTEHQGSSPIFPGVSFWPVFTMCSIQTRHFHTPRANHSSSLRKHGRCDHHRGGEVIGKVYRCAYGTHGCHAPHQACY